MIASIKEKKEKKNTSAGFRVVCNTRWRKEKPSHGAVDSKKRRGTTTGR